MKQIDRRWLAVGRDPRHVLKPREKVRADNDHMLQMWLRGIPPRRIAPQVQLSQEEVYKRLASALRRQKASFIKWKAAEANCRKLAMALRMLRLTMAGAVPDQPIETLNPPPRWLRHFHNAGVMTVNQLRSIDSETLLANYRFDAGALVWAVATLDKMQLSHVLRRPGALYRGG